jgi:outer membrane protein OmpA-like peptidoglycan-associated protein
MSVTRPARNPATGDGGGFQRKCACGGGGCNECAGSRAAAPASRHGALESVAAPSVVRQALRIPGQALDSATRRHMEVRFGHDFNRVRIHTDNDAAEAAQAVSAQAYTVGGDIFFAPNAYAPHTGGGIELLAHELAHVVQQGGSQVVGDDTRVGSAASHHEDQAQRSARTVATGRRTRPLDVIRPTSLQRKLMVDSTSGLAAGGGGAPLPSLVDTDPAANLTPFERLDMMDHVISALCPDFKVDKGVPQSSPVSPTGTGEVVSKSNSSIARGQLSAGNNATGCCCLSVLTEAQDTWTIHVSQLVSPYTRFTGSGGDIVLPPTDTPLQLGSYTSGGSLAFQGLVPAAGHELCGHAALHQLGAHPVHPKRTTSDVHDATVNIENAISSEQGVAASSLRGLAASGKHRGESVDRLTISDFPDNVSDVSGLPAAEQKKLKFAASYIRQNDTFADLIGHSDASEAAAAVSSPDVSEQRARTVEAALQNRGVSPKITPPEMTGSVDRFTRIDGVLASQPASTTAPASAPAERRVEILMPVFAAGAQVPPTSAPTKVDHVPTPNTAQTLLATGDPCERKLVGSAYPKGGKPKAAKP